MRLVRRSRTYFKQLELLLDHGIERFGFDVAEEKRVRVDDLIRDHLARFPETGRFDPELGLRVHGVARTPFVLLYDYDELELRIHFIVHGRADRSRIDPRSVDWS